MKKFLLSVCVLSLFSFNVMAQDDSDIESDTETVSRQRVKTNPDGSKEVEVRSGKVRPARQGGPRVGEIYNEDVHRVVKRVEPLNMTSLGLGPAVVGKIGNESVFYSLQLARHFEVNPWAEMRLGVGTALAGEGSGSYNHLAVGASWFSTNEDISPLFGGEFGLGMFTAQGRDGGAGFHAGLHGGVRFFRTARAQLGLEFFGKMIFHKDDKPVMGGAMVTALF
ncbi:MAG: hypothetical protein KF767_16930 [Bdellovibrionaceae bacterium]|nr:hypothetical protein [Pseudobdellovibrionaceae bacterium]